MDRKLETTIIGDHSSNSYLGECWRFRELLYYLAWRDIIVRHKQAFLGLAWVVLRPLISMAIFTFVFSTIARFPSGDVSYPLFVLAGMVPWQFFAGAVSESTGALIQNTHLINKVYFPKILLPFSQVIAASIDLVVSVALLIALVLLFANFSIAHLWALPVLLLLLWLVTLGISLWFSALTVFYRDTRFITSALVQFGVFLSPVGYGTFMIPEPWRIVYQLNPMVGVIEGFRWALFGLYDPQLPLYLLTASLEGLFIFVTGYLYFKRSEAFCVDLI